MDNRNKYPQGSLFSNVNKSKEAHPDYTGTLELNQEVVEDLSEADVVLSVRLGLSRQPSLRRQVRDLGIPILVIKSDTLPQVTRAMARLLRRQATETAAKVTPPDRASQDRRTAFAVS